MKLLTILILGFALSFNVACSKKDSGSAVATAPNDSNTTDNSGNTIVSEYSLAIDYKGGFQVTNQSVYDQFFEAAYSYSGANTNHTINTNSLNFNAGINCNLGVLDWIFGGSLVDCNSSSSNPTNGQITDYNAYVQWLADEGTVLQVLDASGSTVRLRFYLGSYLEFNNSIFQDQHVVSVDMNTTATRNSAGQLILNGGNFVMTSQSSNDQYFTLSYQGTAFATVQLR